MGFHAPRTKLILKKGLAHGTYTNGLDKHNSLQQAKTKWPGDDNAVTFLYTEKRDQKRPPLRPAS